MKHPDYLYSGITVMALVLSGVLSSCTDDDIQGRHTTGNNISFVTGFASSADGSGQGRSGDIDAATSTTLNVEGADRELFLHSIVVDTIDRSPLCPDTIASRATETTTASIQDMGVFAWAEERGGAPLEDHVKPNYIYNERVTRAGGWKSDHSWPGAQFYMNFCAYSPYDMKGGTIVDDFAENKRPSIAYTVPVDPSKQEDLLTSTVTPGYMGNAREEVRIQFQHVLAGIAFYADPKMLAGKVTKITIDGVYDTGHFIIENERIRAGWYIDEDAPKTSYSIDVDVKVDGTRQTPILTGDQTLMLLPQTLPDGATITIDFTDDLTGTPRHLTASIAGQVWAQGHTNKYYISTSSIHVEPKFNVAISNTDSDQNINLLYNGGDLTLDVTSYYYVWRNGDMSKQVPAGWTTQFSTDNGNTWSSTVPSWLTGCPAKGGNGTDISSRAEMKVATAEIDPSTPANQHNAALKAAAPVQGGPDGFYDLSINTQEGCVNPYKETSNCYIVTAPGKYKFPLVYGNAVIIENGEAVQNESAYKYSGESELNGMYVRYATLGSGTDANTLVNHLGRPVKDAYLKNNVHPAQALLLWQDAENLVSNVKLDDGWDYITFEVTAADIRQGNAVIGVKNALHNGGEIAWSWHIWVTDIESLKYGRDIADKFMPNTMNIGWCDDHVKYLGRSVKVKFTQDETGEEKIFTISQAPMELMGNSTLYQWGRKDPFPAYIQETGEFKQTYGPEQYRPRMEPKPATKSEEELVATCIKKPYIFYTVTRSEEGLMGVANLWDNHIWDEPGRLTNQFKVHELHVPLKTIYDPSPAGEMIPSLSSYAYLSFANLQATQENGIFGWYANIKTAKDFFLPCVPSIEYNGKDKLTTLHPYLLYQTTCYNSVTPDNRQYTSFIMTPTECKWPVDNIIGYRGSTADGNTARSVRYR